MTNTPFVHTTRYRFARSLLASAILGGLMVGCGGDDDDEIQASEMLASVAIPFDISSDEGPRPLATDLVPLQTQDGNDGTFNVAPSQTNPVVTAIGQLDGFSTNASLDIPMPSTIDASSVTPQQSVFLVNALTRQLAPITARPMVLTGGETVLRISPTAVLAPQTQYLVVLTDSIRTTNGEQLALPSLYTQSLESGTGNEALDSAIKGWTEAADGLLERTNTPAHTALAYTFTTGGTSDVLSAVAQNAELVNAQAIDWIDLAPATTDIIEGAPLFATEYSDPQTMVYQGQIALPQGLASPAIPNGALDVEWTNDTGNISPSNPIPTVVRTEHAPIMLTLPMGDYTAAGGQNCSEVTNFTTAVFVHGITSNRSSSLALSQQLAMKGCVATIVIDHPGHGMAPVGDDLTPVLSIDANFATNGTASPWAATVAGLNQAGLPTFANLVERHENIGTNDAQQRVPFNYDPDNTFGSSGSNFINLTNFARARDNLRQAVWDQMTLLASLKNVNINGLTLNTDDIHMVGHSLGAIVATTTAHIVNHQPESEHLPRIQSLIAANPGAQITRLLQNSPMFRSQIVGGLAANGVVEGSADFESFMQVFQGMLDSVDAINFIALNQTPTLMFEMVGGGELNDNASFGPLDAVKAAFQGVYPRDHVVPNFDYAGNSSLPYANILGDDSGFNSVIESAVSPLAGTTPLAQVGGLLLVNQSTAPMGNRLLVRFQQGAHTTFASADDLTVFTEMANQTLSFIQNGELTITESSVLAP